jgi:hypothetical protein
MNSRNFGKESVVFFSVVNADANATDDLPPCKLGAAQLPLPSFNSELVDR